MASFGECVFCYFHDKEIVAENEYAVAILDKYPMTPGHTLIIPRRHFTDILEAGEDELLGIFELLRRVRRKLAEDYGTEDCTMLINYGKMAGQTIEHMHLHCLPRG